MCCCFWCCCCCMAWLWPWPMLGVGEDIGALMAVGGFWLEVVTGEEDEGVGTEALCGGCFCGGGAAPGGF